MCTVVQEIKNAFYGVQEMKYKNSMLLCCQELCFSNMMCSSVCNASMHTIIGKKTKIYRNRMSENIFEWKLKCFCAVYGELKTFCTVYSRGLEYGVRRIDHLTMGLS